MRVVKWVSGAGLITVVVVLWLQFGQQAPRREIRNVLLISLDTTRADHLACYGYPGPTTPNIDAIAAEGVLFENVVAPVPLTLPSHASMLTGTIPPYHGVRDNLFLGLGPQHDTLAETLGRHGFKTGAIVSAVVLHRIYGLDRGFDTYDDRFGPSGEQAEQTADVTTRKAIEWIEAQRDERFFLFLHYYDPHAEYTPPQPFASRFAGSPYAGEIAFTDHGIGQVIATLKKHGLYDSTLIVIVGDHGEMLGAHGESSHGYFIYEPAIRVPLIIRRPGGPGTQAAVRVESMAGVVDVTPTICSLLGIDPPSPVQGMDLASRLDGDTGPNRERHMYCESLTPTKYMANGLRALAGPRWKYIETTRPELYDLAADPQEHNNVLSSHPEVADELAEQLLELVTAGDGLAVEVGPDEQTLARLRSLGYVGGTVQVEPTVDPSRDDPKDLVEFHNRFSEVELLVSRKQYGRAAEICRSLVEQRPEIALLHQELGGIALNLGHYDEAVSHCREALALDGKQFLAARDLALAQTALGLLDVAVESYRAAISIRPNEPRVHYQIAQLYYRRGNLEKALAHAEVSARLNPDVAAVHTALGRMHREQGRYEQAIEHYGWAVELRPDAVMYLDTLAATQADHGDLDAAVATAQRALTLYEARNQPGEAIEARQRFELYQARRRSAAPGEKP